MNPINKICREDAQRTLKTEMFHLGYAFARHENAMLSGTAGEEPYPERTEAGWTLGYELFWEELERAP